MPAARVILLVGSIGLAAAPAAAAEVPSDPLARCIGLAAQASLFLASDAIGSIEPIGGTGCRFSAIRHVTKDMTISVGSLTIDQIDFARLYDHRMPDRLVLRIEDLAFAGAEDWFQWPDALPVDITIDYTLDPDTRQLTLTEFAIRGDGFGELALSAAFDGYAWVATGGFGPVDPQATSLRSARLRYGDKGFVDRLATILAKHSGRDRQAQIELDRRNALATIAMLPSYGVPDAAVAGLTAFIQDLPMVRGPITIAVEPASPVPLARLDALRPGDPASMDTVKDLNIAVSY